MARYELWSSDELREAILDIERNLAGGIDTVSNPTQGAIAYSSRADAEAILDDLYVAYYRATSQLDKLRQLQQRRRMRIYRMSGHSEV